MNTNKDYSQYRSFEEVLADILTDKGIEFKEEDLSKFTSILEALKFYETNNKQHN